MSEQKPYIYNVSTEDLAKWMEERNYPRFRLQQLLNWLPRGLTSVDDLTDMSKAMRRELAESFSFDGLKLEREVKSGLDATTRYVFALEDGNGVEAVYMEYKTGHSVCLSTQSGCRMGCKFCASTGIGFGRNLTAGELLAQVTFVARAQNVRISHVVLMGIGEPLENYDEVVKFIRLLNDPKGLNISLRHVTLSTCGLVPEICRLADEALPITLAISLHAPNDSLRKHLMPIANRYSMSELMEAVRYYLKQTGRRITYEYAMFRDVNDHLAEAEQLAKLLRGQLAHVNLIPANEFAESAFHRSEANQIKKFQQYLLSKSISCTVRRELGGDIAAACGQLRRKRENKS